MMMSSKHEQALAVFLTKLKEEYASQLVQVILFGSYRKDKALPDSDIDLLVVTVAEDYQLRRAIISLSTEVFLEFAVDISPKVLSQQAFEQAQQQNNSFIEEVLTEGEILV